MRVAFLDFDVDRLKAIHRVHDRWQHQAGRVGARKAAVAVNRPLHGRANTVPVAQVDVIAHADLVAVIQRRCAGHRQQHAVEQLDPATIAIHQRCQAPTDAQVDPCAAVGCVVIPQIVTLTIGDHFQSQLIVVAQENRPLAVFRNFRRLPQNIGDRKTIFLGQRHVHAWHQRKVKSHVAFIAIRAFAVTKIQLGVFRPLIGLGQQHAVRIVRVDLGTNALEHLMGFRQVLVVGAVPLDEVRNGIQTQTVDAQIQPEAHDFEDRIQHVRIVEIQVRLVGVETVPEVLAGNRVPSPVGRLGIEKDDPRTVVLLIGVRPHIEIPRLGTGLGIAGFLEPWMLVGSVVDDQFADHSQAALVGLGDETLGIGHGAVVAVHVAVFGNIVAIVPARRRIKRQQPDGVDAQRGNVVELFDQARKIADSVVIGIKERFHVNLINHRVLVPERVFDKCRVTGLFGHY